MCREVRRVPKNWGHPKKDGEYIQLFNDSYSWAAERWDKGKDQWSKGLYEKGYRTDQLVPLFGRAKKNLSFEQCAGERPLKGDYMPDWDDDEKTHYQMYETLTEGTPISPVMNGIESLAHWLTDHNVNVLAGSAALYEGWIKVCKEDLIIELGDMMRDVSEECQCAGWLIDLEYLVPILCERAIKSQERQPWGQGYVTVEQAMKMTRIAEELKCWVANEFLDNEFHYVEFNPFPIPDKYYKSEYGLNG